MEEGRMLQEAIEKQADYIVSLEYANLSEATVENAKMILLDSIGCMAAGNAQYNSGCSEPGDYTIVGAGKADKESAVFMNGAAMVKNELDEGNQFAFGHPACHIVPAMLAETEKKKFSGKEVITALAAAYEVSCRWGCSAKLKPQMHVHGTMQTLGAAVVSCKLNGCTAEQTGSAMITANSLPQTTSWASAFEGDQLRNAYIGISNCVGMQAFRMNSAGLASSIPTLEHVWKEVLQGSIDTEGLTKDLGKDYYIEKNYYKVHSACRYIHCFADMVKEFMNQGLKAEEVEEIRIETYYAAAKLSGQTASNSFAMRFSIPVSIAVCMIFGDLAIETVTDEHVRNFKVPQLAKKIYVTENPTFTSKLPDIRENKITVRTTTGRVYCKDALTTKGDYTDPFSKEELIEKFNRITADVWTEERRTKITDFCSHLDTEEDFSKIFRLLVK